MERPPVIPRPAITVAQVILLTLGTRGAMTFQEIIAHPSVHLLESERTANSFYTALARLKRRKHVIRTGDAYELTENGQYAVLKAYIRKELTGYEKKGNDPAKDSRQLHWDGRWRLVLFDMPESKRPLRDYLRNLLKRLGLYEFQRSMWIWPYKMPPFVLHLLEDPLFRRHTKLITTSDIDYDADLRRQFKLMQ